MSSATTIKVLAYKSTLTDSPVITATYTPTGGGTGLQGSDVVDNTGTATISAGQQVVVDTITELSKRVVSPFIGSQQTTTYYFGDKTTSAMVSTVSWDSGKNYITGRLTVFSSALTNLLATLTAPITPSFVLDNTASPQLTWGRAQKARLSLRVGKNGKESPPMSTTTTPRTM